LPSLVTRKLLWAVVLLLALGVAAAIGPVRARWRDLHEPFRGYEAAEQFVEVPTGAGSGQIGRRLVDAGVVRDESTFRTALWWTGRARDLQAGEYRFERPMTPLQVVETLVRGDVYTQRITFPEGLTIGEMADLYAAGGFGDAAQFVNAAGNASAIRDLDPAGADLEGYLFPDTYALPRRTPAAALVALMVARFRAIYTDELHRSAEAQGLTLRQVVTLASLVEKETGRPDERPLVAAVYRNRLRLRMGLQADPTVVYAMRKAGRYTGNIRRQDLAMDSPYNTYRYAGLPPGPIAAPGEASIRAALAPADVDYLYFVSRNDGSHVFARTLAEHNRNVREFQVLFFRRQAAGRQPPAGR
jgi:UPF0755 protein